MNVVEHWVGGGRGQRAGRLRACVLGSDQVLQSPGSPTH